MPDAESPDLYPKAEPSVLIGIFPAAAVHVRHNAVTESEVLTAAHEQARELAEARSRELRMAAVQEEDEFDDGEREQDDELEEGEHGLDDRPNGNSNVIRRPHRPKSLVLAAKPRVKEQPPLPTLTAGDSTVAGQQWPLVDEIACAIREWYAVSCVPRVWWLTTASANISGYARVPSVQRSRPAHRRAVPRPPTTVVSDAEQR